MNLTKSIVTLRDLPIMIIKVCCNFIVSCAENNGTGNSGFSETLIFTGLS